MYVDQGPLTASRAKTSVRIDATDRIDAEHGRPSSHPSRERKEKESSRPRISWEHTPSCSLDDHPPVISLGRFGARALALVPDARVERA